MENEVKQTEVEPQKPTSNSNKFLVILGLFSSVFLIALCVYILYTDGVFSKATYDNNDTNTQEEKKDTPEDTTQAQTTTETKEDDKPTTVKYEGDTVTVTLPNDTWKIIEYYDGDGTESLPEYTTYTGLTALDITKNNTKIFSLHAVSGIGFVGCSDYAQFEDTNPGHLSQQESINDEIGGDMTLHDYTDTKYSEFEWLGITFRRVEKNYYYDTQEGNNYFESPCQPGLLTLEGLSYEDADGYKGEAYFYGPTEDATLSDLEIVDSILESMILTK